MATVPVPFLCVSLASPVSLLTPQSVGLAAACEATRCAPLWILPECLVMATVVFTTAEAANEARVPRNTLSFNLASGRERTEQTLLA